jgi:hypothetical protein
MQKYSIKNGRSNYTTHQKDHSPQPSWLYHRNAGMVQYIQINECNTLAEAKTKKHFIISIYAEKAFDKI